MRSIGLAFLFVIAFGTAGFGAVDDRPLVEPDFAVPDLSDQAALLEERFLALAQHLRALEQRLSRQGVDQRLDEIFLPAASVVLTLNLAKALPLPALRYGYSYV